ncbi:MAG TPA: DUF445 domain-containing protein [Gammaproteobacteria bacterium]|nr:DUF445 domain-containing protein [Gammaproteobacteria bacterium]
MNPSDIELHARLRRAQWVAGGLLAAMGALFISTRVLVATQPGLGVVVAFAEAALIGGLADWFAVTALFRHPLGLPIPHTAIVPARKNEIGRALARFIGDHFLVGAAVEKRLAHAELTRRLGDWLQAEVNAKRLSRDISTVLDWLLRSVESSELRGGLRRMLGGVVERIPVNEAVAAIVNVFATGNNAQLLIDQLTQFGRQQLERNKASIRTRIEERSPWWMPKFVDEEIYDQLVSEFERLLDEIGENQEHPARVEFNERLHSLHERLIEDESIVGRLTYLRNEFFQNEAVRSFFQSLWNHTREALHTQLHDESSDIRLSIEREIRQVGRTLSGDIAAQRRLDSWFSEAIVYVVDHYRGPLSEVISDTVAEWDARSTADRIELHIGKDLQFIRINGTLVGGIVGVVIYLLSGAFL